MCTFFLDRERAAGEILTVIREPGCGDILIEEEPQHDETPSLAQREASLGFVEIIPIV
jgi:hypothetical protein